MLVDSNVLAMRLVVQRQEEVHIENQILSTSNLGIAENGIASKIALIIRNAITLSV